MKRAGLARPLLVCVRKCHRFHPDRDKPEVPVVSNTNPVTSIRPAPRSAPRPSTASPRHPGALFGASSFNHVTTSSRHSCASFGAASFNLDHVTTAPAKAASPPALNQSRSLQTSAVLPVTRLPTSVTRTGAHPRHLSTTLIPVLLLTPCLSARHLRLQHSRNCSVLPPLLARTSFTSARRTQPLVYCT